MVDNKEQIKKYNKELVELLEKENRRIDFERRWKDLDEFRFALSEYVNGYDKNNCDDLSSKLSILPNGHILDHHVLGYYAPMRFDRWGFENNGRKGAVKRNHVEQIRILSDFFIKRGLRFIYVPLPCKVAIWPEIAVNEKVIPKDSMVIPQWRKVILELAYNGIEIVDCYSLLKKNKENVFTRNHHISPIGGGLISESVSNYIIKTTDYGQTKTKFINKEEIIGSTVLQNSGNSNSLELGAEYFETTRVLYIDEFGSEKPYLGREEKSEIAIIGDCNLQSYRGTGADVTAQITGRLRYPVRYLGRYLPFAKNDSINKLPQGILRDVNIVVYIGFVSASFVRAVHFDDTWCTILPDTKVFV